MVDIDEIIYLHGDNKRNLQIHPVHKFGYNPALSNQGYESIWFTGGLYPWSVFDAGTQSIFVKSTSASDTGDITVEGLDADWNKVTTTKTMTGATAIQLDQTFRRIYRAEYVDTANIGVISIHAASGTGTVVASIQELLNQTQIGLYTIPAGYTGYLLNYTASCGKGDDATIRMFTRETNDTLSFKLKTEVKIYQATHLHEFASGLLLPEKTDIDFRARTTSAGSEMIINFDMILVDETTRTYVRV